MVEILASLERGGADSPIGKAEPRQGDAGGINEGGAFSTPIRPFATRQVEQRLLNALSTADISQLRKLLEACLIGVEREHPGNSSDQ